MTLSNEDIVFARDHSLTATSPRKDTGVAVLLNFLWTGAGNLYNGKTGKGIVLVVITLILVITIIGIIVWIPLWIWGMFDAASEAKKVNRIIEGLGEQEDKAKEQNKIGKARTEKEAIVNTLTLEDMKKRIKQAAALVQEGLIDAGEFDRRISQLASDIGVKKLDSDKDDYLMVLAEFKKSGILTEQHIKTLKVALI